MTVKSQKGLSDFGEPFQPFLAIKSFTFLNVCDDNLLCLIDRTKRYKMSMSSLSPGWGEIPIGARKRRKREKPIACIHMESHFCFLTSNKLTGNHAKPKREHFTPSPTLSMDTHFFKPLLSSLSRDVEYPEFHARKAGAEMYGQESHELHQELH